MRRRRGRAKFFLEGWAEAGVGGGSDTVGDRIESLNEKDPLIALAGCEVGGEGLLRGNLGKFTPALALTGLKTGVIASRNWVYAFGMEESGVIGVDSSSCLVRSEGLEEESLLECSSEGNDALFGVFSG